MKIVTQGFTLIELMITVAIIGILSAVAVPKFAGLLTKSKEATAKAKLGSLRSALSIYNSDTDGVFPSNGAGLSTALTTESKYLKEVPTISLPHSTHAEANGITDAVGDTNFPPYAWAYVPSDAIRINCTHTDSRGLGWSSY